ncbi:hypothetical protein [Arthrobacter sp. FW306-06-A]|uniref:hypothetical protein n=1 Tax=Arthrobacter sp. FW306-06-A TaxID=2879621 RepID=UPI001F40D0FE|nr:hypothetical protein [Arthrobacter sp. FW306-06-A]UKA69590.1 hypothetical protein LFT49_12485 [Arthrobacter sp. FW306-06-A]
MTGVTTWNKSTAPAGADGWNLTTDVRKAIETSNFPVPVSTVAERDALAPPTGKYAGMQVIRTDLPGCPVETWDGSAWQGVSWVPYTPTWGGWANLGDGFVSTGSYFLIGKLCHVRMKLVAGGAGANMGTDQLAVTLPFTSASDQVTVGQGEWLGNGPLGGIQNLFISNPPSNNQASLLSPGSGTGIAVSPGSAGYGWAESKTEVHTTLTYRID